MGKILTDITITNNEDLVLSRKNYIKSSEVRTVDITDVLVDTGATTLCLTEKYIRQLDLPHLRSVLVTTANGVTERRIYDNIKLRLTVGDEQRETLVECIELSNESSSLLGVIPLESLSVELDLQKQTLRFLPEDTKDTYWMIYWFPTASSNVSIIITVSRSIGKK